MPAPRQQAVRLLLTYLRPWLWQMALLAALLLGSIVLQLVNPQVLRRYLDAVQHAGAAGQLLGIGLLFIAVALVQQALSLAATYFSERLAWLATNDLRADLAAHCLRLDMGFHKRRTPGELIERIDGDVTAMANFFSQFVVQIVGNLLFVLGVLVALWLADWRAGLALSVFAVVILGVMLLLRAIAVPYWRAARQASADLFGFLEERLGGTEDIRSNGAVAYVMRRLYERTRERTRAVRQARFLGGIGWAVPIPLMALGTMLSFVLAGYLFHQGILGIGAAFLIYYYTRLMFDPINAISFQIDDFQQASAGIARVQELLTTTDALRDGDGAPFPHGALAVEFRDVSFGYGEDEMVLHDISFQLQPGRVLGLLGRTGSGKTTVARLLTRLYDPAAGAVLLGGRGALRALSDARRYEVRERVGLVTQDVQLFRGTVRENLTFFAEDTDDARLLAALQALGLADWLGRLPDGLDTMLEAGGSNLSAGEAQLLAFTRAFLRDPGVVVLDEASSRLDPLTERLIERAVDRLLEGRTGIIIAHRLGTVERADDVMILEGGRVLEAGERTCLAADPRSRYAQLLQSGLTEVLV